MEIIVIFIPNINADEIYNNEMDIRKTSSEKLQIYRTLKMSSYPHVNQNHNQIYHQVAKYKKGYCKSEA